ncbi:MAG TPA: hypothetical protein VH353_03845 [Caulobacteraceae bacterium]|jgi:hypothetical protein|nr:hypothetical protein [Caulobacteraceae bacterium]
MKHYLAAACAAFSLGMAGAAFADGPVTATLEQPTAPAKLIAAHAVFRCEGTTCIASTAPDSAGDLDSCKTLSKQVGRLSAYGQFKPLDDKALAKCNAVAAAPKAATTAAR